MGNGILGSRSASRSLGSVPSALDRQAGKEQGGSLMNQGRNWCLVQPTAGQPRLLGAVAAISFIVHFARLGNAGRIAGSQGGG